MSRMVNDKPYCKNCQYNKGFAGCKARECPQVGFQQPITLDEALQNIEEIVGDLSKRERTAVENTRMHEAWQFRDWLKELKDFREETMNKPPSERMGCQNCTLWREHGRAD